MSIQSQINAAQPNTTITIAAGTYNEGATINKPLTLKVSGLVKIVSPAGLAGLRIGANNVTINGLFNGVPSLDIFAVRDDGIEGNEVHHATVRGVIAHDCGESGIQFNWSEFIVIENCITYRNAKRGWYSGISVYQCREIGGPGPEPRVVIRDNVSYDNWTLPTVLGEHTDGNGIIVDDNNSTQNGNFPAWKHQTLIENNLCFRNGSKGIAVAWSDFTTVRNNTTFGNNGDAQNSGTWRGDISLQSSRDCTLANNIAVADPTTHANSSGIGVYGGENVRNAFSGNVVWPSSDAVHRDGSNNQFGGYTVANPQMPGTSKPKQARGAVTFVPADWIPAAAAAANAGWRPAGVVVPPVDPPVDPPVTVDPRLVALEKQVAAMAAEYGARIMALEAAVAGLQAPSLSGIREELARLDVRLDAISGAAGD